MNIYYVLPHLCRNGGIKVAIQHCHLLNKNNYNCFVLSPSISENPYKNYNYAKFMTWKESYPKITNKDIIIFNWFEDVNYFLSAPCKKFYFAQGCFFIENGYPNHYNENGKIDIIENNNIEIISVGKEVQNYFLYGFNRNSKIINNWINEKSFYFEPDKKIKNKVGVINTGRYSCSEQFEEKLKLCGLELMNISGDEQQVGEAMKTCEYFIGFSQGIGNGWRKTEGFSLPCAEAMACGCITISYDNHGNREYLFDKINGFITKTNTEEEIISIIKNIDNKEFIIQNSIKTISLKFSEEEIVSQIKRTLQI